MRPLTARELRLAREADAKARRDERAREREEEARKTRKLKNSGSLKAAGAFIASVATATGIALGVVARLDARAQERVDAGVGTVTTRVVAVESDVKETKTRLTTVEHATTRTEAMVEMLVNNRGLRPPPKVILDGGE